VESYFLKGSNFDGIFTTKRAKLHFSPVRRKDRKSQKDWCGPECEDHKKDLLTLEVNQSNVVG